MIKEDETDVDTLDLKLHPPPLCQQVNRLDRGGKLYQTSAAKTLRTLSQPGQYHRLNNSLIQQVGARSKGQ